MPDGPIRPISVSDYAARVRRAARKAGAALVEGEVQRTRLTNGGALMFDLTDGESRLPCKLLPRSQGARLVHRPREGDLVRVAVSHPDFWGRGGVLSVVCDQVRLTGTGELLRRRRELLARLEAEGLTDPAALPPLPRFPRAVGVIAGENSSALADVIACLAERFPRARVRLAACPVQGAGAAAAIVGRVAQLVADASVDVIIIARGGGSVQDLAAFDEERLCRALRASRTPVIAAVGHTDNDPVCNAVTHSAHVPRHAAELAVPDRRVLLRELDGTGLALDRAGARAAAELGGVAAALDEFRELGSRRVAGAAERRGEVGLLGSALSRAGRRELSAFGGRRRESLGRCADAMAGGTERCLGRAREELERGRRAIALSGARQGAGLGQRGQALLGRFAASDFSRRGWVLASDAKGHSVSSVDRVRVGERLRLRLADGEVAVLVEGIAPR